MGVCDLGNGDKVVRGMLWNFLSFLLFIITLKYKTNKLMHEIFTK